MCISLLRKNKETITTKTKRYENYEELVNRLGLTITTKEQELDALKKRYNDLIEEWDEDCPDETERVYRFGLSITDKEQEIEMLKNQYENLLEEWKEYIQNNE